MSEDVDAVVELSFAVQARLSELAAEHDLSLTQFRLLAILRDREPAMLDLARHMRLGKSGASGLIDRAERRGLVERTTSAADGRVTHVRLTTQGRELTERVEGQAYAALEELFAHLPARDRTRLTALARAVTRAR